MACIDHSSYPHIVDRILAYAPNDVLASFRATSKHFAGAAHQLLYEHVRISHGGRGFIVTTPTGDRLPGLHIINLDPSLSDESVQIDKLRNIRVLDYMTEVEPPAMLCRSIEPDTLRLTVSPKHTRALPKFKTSTAILFFHYEQGSGVIPRSPNMDAHDLELHNKPRLVINMEHFPQDATPAFPFIFTADNISDAVIIFNGPLRDDVDPQPGDSAAQFMGAFALLLRGLPGASFTLVDSLAEGCSEETWQIYQEAVSGLPSKLRSVNVPCTSAPITFQTRAEHQAGNPNWHLETTRHLKTDS